MSSALTLLLNSWCVYGIFNFASSLRAASGLFAQPDNEDKDIIKKEIKKIF